MELDNRLIFGLLGVWTSNLAFVFLCSNGLLSLYCSVCTRLVGGVDLVRQEEPLEALLNEASLTDWPKASWINVSEACSANVRHIKRTEASPQQREPFNTQCTIHVKLRPFMSSISNSNAASSRFLIFDLCTLETYHLICHRNWSRS